jgi:hypothetical protein
MTVRFLDRVLPFVFMGIAIGGLIWIAVTGH